MEQSAMARRPPSDSATTFDGEWSALHVEWLPKLHGHASPTELEAVEQEFDRAKAALRAKYKVSVELSHQAPPGWKGAFLGPPVTDLDSFGAWIEQQLVTHALLRGNDRTRHLRDAIHNARCLIAEVGLEHLPAMPSDADALDEHQAALFLNEIRRITKLDSKAAPADPRPNASVIARALAILKDHPDWPVAKIADAVPCNSKYLSQSMTFRAARKAIKEAGAAEFRRAKKHRGRDMDEYEDEG
jgi:hypothetical protein